MIMRARPFNWLLIGLMVVAFAGRSWAQPGCGAVGTVAMDSANSTATHKAGEIAASETATQKHDSGKAKSADCVKCCAATQVLGLIAMAWSPDVWPQIHLAAVEVALHGQMPKPELVPPIALV
jgi:uncharacterized protein (DUF2342 family)